jgi:HEAT repeat protein
MRHPRQFPQSFSRLPGLLVAIALWSAQSPSSAQNDDRLPVKEERLTPAVEALRDALRSSVRDPSNKEELKQRRQTLQERVNALHGVRDLRLAMLQDWRDDEDVLKFDRELHKQVADRLANAIRDALKSRDAVTQIAAADLVADIGDKIRALDSNRGFTAQFAPDLASLAKDRNPAVLEAATRALGRVNAKPEIAGPALQNILRSGTVNERRTAADALVVMAQGLGRPVKAEGGLARTEGGPEAELSLKEIFDMAEGVAISAGIGLKDPDTLVRLLSAQAIQKAGAILVDHIPKPRETSEYSPFARRITDEEKKDIQELREGVVAEQKEVTGLAKALGEQCGSLSNLLSDPDPETRLTAARALVEIAGAESRLAHRISAVPELEADKKEKAKTGSGGSPQESLLRGLRAGLPAISRTLDDPNADVRLAAMTVLDQMDRDAALAVPTLKRALADRDIFVRWTAARALGNIDPAAGLSAVPKLGRQLFDPDLDARLAAAATLERYGHLAVDALGDLTRALNAGDAEIRVAAIYALEAIGLEAQPAIPALSRALDHPDDRVREASAQALGRFGPLAQSAEPALRRALNDEEPMVRKAASEAILNLKSKKE